MIRTYICMNGWKNKAEFYKKAFQFIFHNHSQYSPMTISNERTFSGKWAIQNKTLISFYWTGSFQAGIPLIGSILRLCFHLGCGKTTGWTEYLNQTCIWTSGCGYKCCFKNCGLRTDNDVFKVPRQKESRVNTIRCVPFPIVSSLISCYLSKSCKAIASVHCAWMVYMSFVCPWLRNRGRCPPTGPKSWYPSIRMVPNGQGYLLPISTSQLSFRVAVCGLRIPYKWLSIGQRTKQARIRSKRISILNTVSLISKLISHLITFGSRKVQSQKANVAQERQQSFSSD